jgi:hypothetical protein
LTPGTTIRNDPARRGWTTRHLTANPAHDRLGFDRRNERQAKQHQRKYRAVIDRHPAFVVAAELNNGVVYRLAYDRDRSEA